MNEWTYVRIRETGEIISQAKFKTKVNIFTFVSPKSLHNIDHITELLMERSQQEEIPENFRLIIKVRQALYMSKTPIFIDVHGEQIL